MYSVKAFFVMIFSLVLPVLVMAAAPKIQGKLIEGRGSSESDFEFLVCPVTYFACEDAKKMASIDAYQACVNEIIPGAHAHCEARKDLAVVTSTYSCLCHAAGFAELIVDSGEMPTALEYLHSQGIDPEDDCTDEIEAAGHQFYHAVDGSRIKETLLFKNTYKVSGMQMYGEGVPKKRVREVESQAIDDYVKKNSGYYCNSVASNFVADYDGDPTTNWVGLKFYPGTMDLAVTCLKTIPVVDFSGPLCLKK